MGVCVCTKSKIIISIQWREVIRFDATWRINLPTLDLIPPFLKCQRMDWICIFMPAVWSHIKYTLTCSITSVDLKHRTYNQAVMKNKHWTRKHSEECTPVQGETKSSSNILILEITGLRRITLLITQVCADRPVILSIFSAFTTKARPTMTYSYNWGTCYCYSSLTITFPIFNTRSQQTRLYIAPIKI